MRTALSMEFAKNRRRHIWLSIAVLILVQLLWGLWSFRNVSAEELAQGWQSCLYQFPLLNAMMMPVIAAVVASRLCDTEHQGHMFKLLETAMPAGRIFDAKFLCGALYMFAAAILQLFFIVLTGVTTGFAGKIPLEQLGYYLLFTTAVNFTILLLQQILSLLFVNQMISLTLGLVGGLAGLFILFLPERLAWFLLWGYYGVLMLVHMDWTPGTKTVHYFYTSINWSGFLILIGMFIVLYIVGRILFVRKEI